MKTKSETKKPVAKTTKTAPKKAEKPKIKKEQVEEISRSRRILGKILDIFIYISVVVFFFSFALIIGFRIASQRSATLAGYQMYEIASNSMSPELQVGDFIIVKPDTKYEPGDIVTYREEDYFVTHRVKSINDDLVVTQGDFNNAEDDPIHTSDIVGKMVKKASFLRFASDFRIPIIAVLAILILIGFFIKRV